VAKYITEASNSKFGMVAEHLIAIIISGRKKHKSDNANMSNYKFCKSEPPKSQGFQHTEKHCWVISIPKT